MSVTLYVVDDDDGHADLIESGLIDANVAAKIKRFANGYDAIDAIYSIENKRELPQCMLLDLNMPGMRGTTLLEILRSKQETRYLPVIVLTSSSTAEEVNHCYSLGCNLYLKKPASYAEFNQVIQMLGQLVNSLCLPDVQPV